MSCASALFWPSMSTLDPCHLIILPLSPRIASLWCSIQRYSPSARRTRAVPSKPSRGDRLTPLLYKSFDIFRMNTGSPPPSQQLLQRLPYEVEPPLIEEIKIAIRPRCMEQ